MKIRVRYFASIREWTGLREEEFDLTEGLTANDLRLEVQKRHGRLEMQEGSILVAVNGSFVESSRVLKQGDEVALFPPVSGG